MENTYHVKNGEEATSLIDQLINDNAKVISIRSTKMISLLMDKLAQAAYSYPQIQFFYQADFQGFTKIIKKMNLLGNLYCGDNGIEDRISKLPENDKKYLKYIEIEGW